MIKCESNISKYRPPEASVWQYWNWHSVERNQPFSTHWHMYILYAPICYWPVHMLTVSGLSLVTHLICAPIGCRIWAVVQPMREGIGGGQWAEFVCPSPSGLRLQDDSRGLKTMLMQHKRQWWPPPLHCSSLCQGDILISHSETGRGNQYSHWAKKIFFCTYRQMACCFSISYCSCPVNDSFLFFCMISAPFQTCW